MLDPTMTTGLPGLDQVLKGLLPGDNVVWQVDTVEEYQALVTPYVPRGRAQRQEARVLPLRPARAAGLGRRRCEVYELDPEQGFENFIAAIHSVIEEAGPGAFYVFDCLSRLAADWYSDQMLANFFMLTCPYLFDLETIAYFALYRNYHTAYALGPIQDTTQLFLDIYRHTDELYIRPVKVQHRYSPTMNMLHVWRGHEFKTVTSSAVISEILTSAKWSGLASDSSVGFWENSFIKARELLQSGEYRPDLPEKGKDLYDQLVKMIISRDSNMQRLITRYLTLQDILDVRKRMIGTGLIGGKTVGMLLARSILKKSDVRFADLLEEHDSFYIGSDVFYDFLVRSGVWWVRQKQRDPEDFLEGAEQARQRILTGEFPPHILQPLRGDGRLLRPVALHRALQLAAGGQLRQLLRRQVRERLLRQPGAARAAPQGPAGRHPHHLRQLHEREGPALPRRPRHARQRRADGAAGHARVGRHVRQVLLPAGGRRRLLVQPLRLGPRHRPQGRRLAAGVRPGHPGSQPLRRRLHAHRRPQRPRQAARDQLRRGGPRRPAARGLPRPRGQPARLQPLPRPDQEGAGHAPRPVRFQRSVARRRRRRDPRCSPSTGCSERPTW